MSADWPVVELGDLVEEITVGFVGSMTQEYVETGVPFFRSKNISEYEINWNDIRYISDEFHGKLKKSKLRPGDVAIVRTGKPGTTCVIPETVTEANCSDIVIVRVDDERLSAHYLSYFMNSIANNQVASHLVGAVQQHFNVGSAKRIEILLPSRSEQEKIVKVLKDLDDKNKLNREINLTLEHIAQAIFKSWFVDFEPTRAKIAARKQFIKDNPDVTEEDIRSATDKDSGSAGYAGAIACERAAMAAISSKTLDQLDQLSQEQHAELKQTASLFPDELVESELGEIPEGWDIGGFSQLARLDTTSVKPYRELEKLWEHFSIPAYDVDKSPRVEFGKEIKSNKYKVSSSAILSSKLNPTTPRTWWPDIEEDNSAICSTEFMQFVPHNSDYRAFVFSLVSSRPFQDGVLQRVTGSTGSRQRAQPLQVANMEVILPSEEIMKAYSNAIESLCVMKAKNLKENISLAEIRDVLLPKILSGELILKSSIEKVERVKTYPHHLLHVST